jgi:hypothetical protein
VRVLLGGQGKKICKMMFFMAAKTVKSTCWLRRASGKMKIRASTQ